MRAVQTFGGWTVTTAWLCFIDVTVPRAGAPSRSCS